RPPRLARLAGRAPRGAGALALRVQELRGDCTHARLLGGRRQGARAPRHQGAAAHLPRARAGGVHMSCERTVELLSDRLKGLLSAEEQRELETHLASCPACREESQGIEELWAAMGRLQEDDDVPHERMRARFHAALAAHDERIAGTPFDRLIARFWPERPALQAGLTAAALVLGLLVGQWLPSPADREIERLREDVRLVGVALLEHRSAAERLRGVEWSQRAASDDRVARALLDTVRYDSSLNVRLAAAEALRGRLDSPE